MLPEGWKNVQLGEISKVTGGKRLPKGGVLVSHDTGYPYIRVTDMLDGGVCISNIKYVPENLSKAIEKYRIFKDDLFITVAGTIGVIGSIPDELNGANLTENADRISEIKANKIFLMEFLRSPFIQSYIENVKTNNAQPKLALEQIRTFPILLPPLPEQKKIAAILSTWDRAIEGTEKLLANSQQQKKALMQQLLTGKKRLPGFTGEWKLSPISAFIKESRISGSSGDVANKITIKLYGRGVIPKEEKREGSESTKYYKRKSGQFIYSKLDFLNGAFGIIPTTLDGYESTLDLPAFDFLHNVSSQWFIFYVSREEFYSANLGLANGGRKARRVNPSDLLRISVPTPSLSEQKAIAAVLTTADEEITALESDLTRLRQEKKALMQQLLTGKRRVTVD